MIKETYDEKICGILLFLTGCLVMAGCDSEKRKTHDLTVGWSISGMPVCKAFLPEGEYTQEEIFFDKVEINVYEDREATLAIQEPVVVPCDKYNYRITRLDRGSYFVKVDALGEYEGNEIPFFTGYEKVAISGGEKDVNIDLAIGKGSVQVGWRFSQGLVCGIEQAGEVRDILVVLNDYEVETPCGEGQILLEGIEPSVGYELAVMGLGADGEVIYEADVSPAEPKVLPGQNLEVEAVF